MTPMNERAMLLASAAAGCMAGLSPAQAATSSWAASGLLASPVGNDNSANNSLSTTSGTHAKFGA